MLDKSYDYLIGQTTNEEIAEAIDNDLDVISTIFCEMESDDENDSRRLLKLYDDASAKEKAIMDAVLICICGWTMSSIVKSSDPMEV